jgi:3-deoxy-D-manno-octulosonic-acid transferase
METEVWPNLLLATHEAGVPMVLANARLSEKSLARAGAWRGCWGRRCRGCRLVLAQTEADASACALGARSVQVWAT